MRETINISTK